MDKIKPFTCLSRVKYAIASVLANQIVHLNTEMAYNLFARDMSCQISNVQAGLLTGQTEAIVTNWYIMVQSYIAMSPPPPPPPPKKSTV